MLARDAYAERGEPPYGAHPALAHDGLAAEPDPAAAAHGDEAGGDALERGVRGGARGVFEHGVEVAGRDRALAYGALALGHGQREPPPGTQTQLLGPGAQALGQGEHVRAHIQRQQRHRVFKAFTVSHVDNLFAPPPC